MNVPHYRPEDEFTEASNAMRLKQLYKENDYTGLLELALVLNHQASFNYSRMMYFMKESMQYVGPITEEHEKAAREIEKDLQGRQQTTD
jgi:hypothetical protein